MNSHRKPLLNRLQNTRRRAKQLATEHRKEIRGAVIVVAVQACAALLLLLGNLGIETGGALVDYLEPDPSQAEKGLERLRETKSNDFWADEPKLAEESLALIRSKWDKYSPLVAHDDRLPAAPAVELEDLLTDESEDPKFVRFEGFISAVSPPDSPFDTTGGAAQMFSLELNDGHDAIWCLTTLPPDRQLSSGEYVSVVGAEIASGDREGDSHRIAYLACPYVHIGRREEQHAEVGELFSDVTEDDGFWRTPPDTAEESVEYLVANWSRVDPSRVHEPYSGTGERVRFGRLYEDGRVDGRLLFVSGFVSQVSTVPAETRKGTAIQQFEIAIAGEATRIWCRSTLPRNRLLTEDAHVGVEGVVIARGSASSSDGGFELLTYMACPNVYEF